MTFRLAVFFLAVCAPSLFAEVHESTIKLGVGSQIASDSIACIPHEAVIKHVECSCNNGTSKQEIAYILGLYQGQKIDAQKFCIGLSRLQQKNMFSALQVRCDYQDDGLRMVVNAEAFWVIKSVKVQGVSLGKQSIVHLYQLRSGERFSKDKHESSLEDIVKDLNKKGYFDAKVDAFFEYVLAQKLINVMLLVSKGPLYFIDDVDIVITSEHPEAIEQKIYHATYGKIGKYILNKPYCEAFIHKKIQHIEQMLTSQGFIYTKVFSDIALSRKKKTVEVKFFIQFDCNQKINFLGNVFFPSSFLITSIMECAHAIGVVPSVILAEEMEELYRSKGFFDARIGTSEDIQNYYFMINEGVRTKIDAVQIKGASFVSSHFLVSRFFKHLVHTHTDEKKITTAVKACTAWYKNQGFWDVQFLKKDYILNQKNNSFSLVCILDEGQQRFLKDVDIQGFAECKKGLLNETFNPLLKIQPLAETMVVQQKLLLEKECKKHGYTNFNINYELIDDEGAFRVLWHVKTGKKMRFGKTIVKGALVDHAKILHVLPYKEGDIWNKDRLHEVYDKFRTLGVYKSVGIQQNILREPDQLCDVILTLEEDDPFEVKLRMGFQQISKNFAFRKGSSYKFGGGFIWKNPLDRLDTFTVDTTLTRFERRTFVSYRQPLFFNAPLETIIKAYSNAYMTPVVAGSRKILYEALQDGIACGLMSKTEHTQCGINSGFEWAKIRDIEEGLARALRFVPELINERVPYWFAEPTLFINYVDEQVNPRNGYFVFASVKPMIPFDLRATALLKCMVEVGSYASWQRLTGAARIRFGHIFMQNFDAIMPPERFYLGGANSLRGYQPDRCPPLGSFVDEEGHTQWVPQGGRSMINANFEVRFPFPVPNLQGALFQDFGILAPDLKSVLYEVTPLAASGFGVRYVTPLGPLRFDIGWKWQKQYEQDTSYAWFLTFGYAW